MLYLQQCTGVVEDSVQPEYNEEFSFSLAAPDIVGKVLKLSLMDHDTSGKRVVGCSVLALDTCGLGEGDLSVKEVWLVISCHILSYLVISIISYHGQVWLNIQEKVTQELTHLLADRLAGCTGVRLDHGCVLGWSCPCGTTRSTGGSPWASSPSGSSPCPHTTTTRVYNNMGTIYPLVTMFTHGRYLREGDAVRGHAGHQGEEDAAAELRRGGRMLCCCCCC